MEKGRVNRFSGVFLRLITLAVAIFIVSLTADIARTKTDSPITLLNATITDTETTDGSILNESIVKPSLEPQRPENTTNKPADNFEGSAEPTHFVAKARAGGEPHPSPAVRQNRRLAAKIGRGEWESIRMRVTAYCPCPKCCGKYCDGVTACGHKIRRGDTFVAADGRYPFGTEMLIPGYSNNQPVRVLDRGGAIKGNRLDVFFDSHEEALEWGVKYLEVNVHRKNH